MPQPTTPEAGEQVPARPHDSGSAANETVDGLDATTEALRHAAEDTPTIVGRIWNYFFDLPAASQSAAGVAIGPDKYCSVGHPTHCLGSIRRRIKGPNLYESICRAARGRC
jgi:hypothetical protein